MTSRPVWLTQEQRDDLTYIVNHLALHDFPGMSATASRVVHQWDAAPADPAKAVRGALLAAHVYTSDEIDGQAQTEAHVDADVVLRALGCPDPEPHA